MIATSTSTTWASSKPANTSTTWSTIRIKKSLSIVILASRGRRPYSWRICACTKRSMIGRILKQSAICWRCICLAASRIKLQSKMWSWRIRFFKTVSKWRKPTGCDQLSQCRTCGHWTNPPTCHRNLIGPCSKDRPSKALTKLKRTRTTAAINLAASTFLSRRSHPEAIITHLVQTEKWNRSRRRRHHKLYQQSMSHRPTMSDIVVHHLKLWEVLTREMTQCDRHQIFRHPRKDNRLHLKWWLNRSLPCCKHNFSQLTLIKFKDWSRRR